MALPKNKIENFISRIESNIARKPASKQTQGEQDVLDEVQQIRKTWEQGNIFTPPLPKGSKREMSWQLFNGLHVLRVTNNHNPDDFEDKISQFYELTKSHNNLFVFLMAGGVYARRTAINGKLKRSEKISHQTLQQAIDLRGSLPETSSISFSALSLVHLERYELELANKYLSRAMEVDPNPTSTNMPVLLAILRSKLQLVQGMGEDALVTIRSIRELHARKPSGLWSDLDIAAYEALICSRAGKHAQAKRIIDEVGESTRHPILDLAKAHILLVREEYQIAEWLLVQLLRQNPSSVHEEPLIDVRLMLALALLGQHKMNRARQIMAETVRIAEPEKFIRPFIEFRSKCLPMLLVVQKSENLNVEAKNFINDILRIVESKHEKYLQVPDNELHNLSMAASITIREQDVLRLLGDGKSNCEIANNLCLSESTVKTHLGNIYSKLNVNNRVQATTRAKELHLV